MKSVNRYTDREKVSRIEKFGKCQPYGQGRFFETVRYKKKIHTKRSDTGRFAPAAGSVQEPAPVRPPQT